MVENQRNHFRFFYFDNAFFKPSKMKLVLVYLLLVNLVVEIKGIIKMLKCTFSMGTYGLFWIRNIVKMLLSVHYYDLKTKIEFVSVTVVVAWFIWDQIVICKKWFPERCRTAEQIAWKHTFKTCKSKTWIRVNIRTFYL